MTTLAYGGHSAEQAGTAETACAQAAATSVIADWPCSDDNMLLLSSLINLRHNPTTSWVPTEGMGVTATGWAFLVAKGTHISAYLSTLALCMLGLRAAPRPSLPTDPPQHTHGPLQKGSVQRPPTAACHLLKLFKSALSVNIF